MIVRIKLENPKYCNDCPLFNEDEIEASGGIYLIVRTPEDIEKILL